MAYEIFDWIRSREQVVEDDLVNLYKKGYRYVVREENSVFLTCYSIKPVKYTDMGSVYWGYKNPEDPAALPADIIKNTDMKEIHIGNRTPKRISDILNISEGEQV